MVINVSTFLTHVRFGTEEYYNYDLREPKRKIINPDKIRETKKTVVTTNDWSNIPYYPTTLERKENMVKYLISMGKQVPPKLLQEISAGKQRELENDAFNKVDQNIYNLQEEPPMPQQQFRQQQQFMPPQQQFMPQQQQLRPPPHKFSPQYASYIGVKPRAQASARIGLGGAF
jgi:hypothetical protein